MPRGGSDFARDPQVRKQIGAIGEHIDHELRVPYRHRFEKWRARRHIHIEFEDPFMIAAESEFARRTEHAIGDGAANLSLFELEPGGYYSPCTCEGVQLAQR